MPTPLRNLLEGYEGKPTMGLQHAGDSLLKVAVVAGRVDDIEVAKSYFDEDGKPLATIVKSIHDYWGKTHGSLKGPVQNGKNALEPWLTGAIIERYNLSNDKVVRSLADFVLSVVTDGFVGKDTTGTQIGNFTEKWRGGGFG